MEIVEADGVRNFKGKISNVSKGETQYGEQWELKIEPIDEDWKDQNLWIKEPDTLTENSIPDNSVMAELIEQFAELLPESKRKLLNDNSPSEFLLKLKGNIFTFKDKVPENGQKEYLYPVEFVKDDSVVENEEVVESTS